MQNGDITNMLYKKITEMDLARLFTAEGIYGSNKNLPKTKKNALKQNKDLLNAVFRGLHYSL